MEANFFDIWMTAEKKLNIFIYLEVVGSLLADWTVPSFLCIWLFKRAFDKTFQVKRLIVSALKRASRIFHP